MNTESNAMPTTRFVSQTHALAAADGIHTMYWSVRRELWENRSLYLALLIVAAAVLVGHILSLTHLPQKMRGMANSNPTHSSAMLAQNYAHAAWLLILTGSIVGVFYSLDALYSERRDRSILFWKSLPVSDLTTVLSKASIPLLVLPAIIFAITLVLQLLMLLLSSSVLLWSGVGTASLSGQLPLFQMQLVTVYTLVVLTLWYAPIYGWLLLISAWARRATFLWFLLPPLALCLLELIAFHTSHVSSLLKNRLAGFAAAAFAFRFPDGTPIDPHLIPLSQLTPGRFLGSPGLWIGLLCAAAFLTVAIRLRRYREPL